jgi:monoamine oxidase
VDGDGEDRGDLEITRRTLIGGAAVGAVGAALPAAAEARKRKRKKKKKKTTAGGTQRKADVAVVGAGLAGLTAAREIVKAGRSVLVLEARNRVGGRTLNHPIGGGKVVEIGGQWVGPTQDRILALANELGVGTFKTYNTGDYLYFRNGSATRYQNLGPPLGAIPPDPGSAEVALALSSLDSMAREVPKDAPWTAARAAEWDGQTFETWKLGNTVTDGGRLILDIGIEAVFACEPRDVSLLHVLFYFGSAPDTPADTQPGGSKTNARYFTTGDGAQDSRFIGGSQLVSQTAAARLGGRVLLSSPVRRITQTGSGVTLQSDVVSVTAKQAIVTGPPAVTAQIRYDPQLPADRAQLLQRFPQGSVIKCHAVYDRPFWRDQGLAGQIVSDAHPVRVTFDNTPPDGRPGVMLGFIEGEDARVYSRKPAAERRAAVLANFASYFGPEALNPTSYFEMNWSTEEWTRGCYGGYLPPGVLLDYGPAIRASVGRIHWAGAETATVWNGYMDGAVRSGESAAKAALAAL